MSNLDLADIKVFLKNGSPIVQAQGLSALIVLIRREGTGNAKSPAAAELKGLFFDCLLKFGRVVSDSAHGALDSLIKEGVFAINDVITECDTRLQYDLSEFSEASWLLLRRILCISPDIIKISWKLLRKYGAKLSRPLVDIVESAEEPEIRENRDLLFMSLLFSVDVDKTEKLRILLYLKIYKEDDLPYYGILSDLYFNFFLDEFPHISRDLEKTSMETDQLLNSKAFTSFSSDACTIELDYENIFTIAEKTMNKPGFLHNPSLPTVHLLLPTLLTIYNIKTELAKSCPDADIASDLSQLKLLMEKCRSYEPVSIIEREDVAWNDAVFFQHVYALESIEPYIDMCTMYIDNMKVTDTTILFIAGLLPRCEQKKEIVLKWFDLLKKLIEKRPENAYQLVLHFMALYSKPYYPIDRSLIVGFLKEMALINRYVLNMVVKFLIVVTQQKGQERVLAMEALGDLVERYPTIFDMLSPLVSVNEMEDVNWMKTKMNLMKRLCLATDRSDDLLPTLSELMKKKNGAVLAATIDVIIALCEEDILDMAAVRKQLSGKVRQEGNEEALGVYCSLLALAAEMKGEDEAEIKEIEELQADCFRELWALKDQMPGKTDKAVHDVKRSAWKALGCFRYDIPTMMDLIQSEAQAVNPLEKKYINDSSDEVFAGYTDYLHKVLNTDVQRLSRTLYTKKHTATHSLFEMAAPMHEALLRTNQESPWMWSASVSLFPYINNSSDVARASSAGLKLLRRMCCEVPRIRVEPTGHSLQQSFLGWKKCVESMMRTLLASTISVKVTDIVKARNHICEQCKFALQQSTLAIDNVSLILAALHEGSFRIAKQATLLNSEFHSAMKPWLISIFEFLLPFVLDYKPKSHPIFEIVVSSSTINVDITRAVVWRLYKTSSKSDIDCLPDDLFQKFSILKILQLESKEEKTSTAAASGEIGKELAALKSSAETEEDIKKLFSLLMQLPSREIYQLEKPIRKQLDKVWATGGEALKRVIYEGLSECAVSTKQDEVILPTNYADLPDDSLLAALVNLLSGADKPTDLSRAAKLFSILSPMQRSDLYTLPPLDWYNLLSLYSDWQKDESFRLSVLRLACQEKNAELLLVLSEYWNLDNDEFCHILARYLEFVLTVLPEEMAKVVLMNISKLARRRDDLLAELIEILDTNSSKEVVSSVLRSLLSIPVSLLDPLINKMKFFENLSPSSSVENHSLMRVFGMAAMNLTMENRISKMLEVVSLDRYSRRHSSEIKGAYLDYFMILLCSAPSSLPTNWIVLDPESFFSKNKLLEVVYGRCQEYWRSFVERKEFQDHAKVFTKFLYNSLKFGNRARQPQKDGPRGLPEIVSYNPLEECDAAEQQQKGALRAMIQTVMMKLPETIDTIMEHGHGILEWKVILGA